MKPLHQRLSPLLAATGLLMGISSVDAALVVYEPFDDSDGSLAGNTPGEGLTGTWSGGGSNPSIVSGLTYGDMLTSGNAARVASGWVNNQVAIDSTPAYNALLADGGQMWFSLLLRPDWDPSNLGSAARFAFGIGDAGFSANGNLNSPITNQAVGFGMATNARIYAGVWDDNDWGNNNLQGAGAPNTSTNPSENGVVVDETISFIVGHVTWGATAGDLDTVNLYMPGLDFVLNAPVSTAQALLSQDSFSLIATSNLNPITIFDEIRIGATYRDVIGGASVVPEPTTMALLLMAGTMFGALRRAKNYC